MIARPSRSPAARDGITLLEVLVAMAIFLMALVAIARLIDSGTDRAMDAIYQNTGTRLAQSKLAEVEAGAVAVPDGGSGTFDDEPDWQWSVECEAAPVPNVYPVTVRVWRDLRGVRFEVALSQMVFDPYAMGTAAEAVPPDSTGGGS